TVGGSGRMLEALDHWLPGVADRIMARLLPGMQQSRIPAHGRGPAGLSTAAGDARERSGAAVRVLGPSPRTAGARQPLAALGVLVVAAGAVAFAAGLARHRTRAR